jgi:hypothetical protein
MDISTFSSWLKELKASGGSDGPEAILAALRHTTSDCRWRSDAEKVIIVVTDAPPHSDGDCCNAEGDTLDGTIFGLTDEVARVHVIGPDDAALKSRLRCFGKPSRYTKSILFHEALSAGLMQVHNPRLETQISWLL